MNFLHILELFIHTREHVTEEMIWRGIPNDPGSMGYFQRWKEIRNAPGLPAEWDGDVTEVIHSMSVIGEQGVHVSRFRSFVACVGLHGVVHDLEPIPEMLNYHLSSLIFDCLMLRDVRQARLIRVFLRESRPIWDKLRANRKTDAPVFSWSYFAELVLAALDGNPHVVESAANELMRDEANACGGSRNGSGLAGGYALFSGEFHFSQHGVWADLATWSLAPFSTVRSVEIILMNIQAWRACALSDEHLSGLEPSMLHRLREIEHVDDFRSAGMWGGALPPLDGAMRELFRGRLQA